MKAFGKVTLTLSSCNRNAKKRNSESTVLDILADVSQLRGGEERGKPLSYFVQMSDVYTEAEKLMRLTNKRTQDIDM